MDRGSYFGAKALDYFLTATNMTWVGGYLDSPAPFGGEIRPPSKPAKAAVGHNRSGTPRGAWMDGLQEARAHGWGVLTTYWGQQDPANADGPWDPRPIAATNNAADAIAKAASARLDPHTVLYLDWEIGGAPSASGKAYMALWFELIAEAGYRPGLYAHNPAITKMRTIWPDIFGWVTNPWVTAKEAVVSPRVGTQVMLRGRDPGQSGVATDRDNIAWQMWFEGTTHWPAALTFPAPGAPAKLPVMLADGTQAVNASGHPVIEIDASTSSVADPGFPEHRVAPGLVRRGRFSAALVDANTIATYAVRRGNLTAFTWSTANPAAAVALPDHILASNPWSTHAAVKRGTSGDLVFVARSAVIGTADNAWQLHAYRRRNATWTFDSNISGTTAIEPLLGVQVLSRAPDTLEAFFVTNDGTNRMFAISCVDVSIQSDGQTWSVPVVVNAPAGTTPSLVGGIGAANRAPGVADVFIVARPSAGTPYNLFWNSSSILGTWPTFSVPGDPAVQVHPFSNVAATSRGQQLVDVFAIAKGTNDANWILYTWWWNQADSWGVGPPVGTYHTQPIVGTAVRPHPVSKVAAVSRSSQYIDVFVVGYADGFLYTVHWDGTTSTWSDFVRVGRNAIQVGSVDGAFSRDPNSIDVFVTGRDGNVYVASWNSTTSTFTDLIRITQLDVS